MSPVTTLATRCSRKEKVDETVQLSVIKPDYAKVHNNLGTRALFQKGRVDEAIAHYQHAQIDPDYAKAHNNAAMLRQRKYGRSDCSLSKALELERAADGRIWWINYCRVENSLQKQQDATMKTPWWKSGNVATKILPLKFQFSFCAPAGLLD